MWYTEVNPVRNGLPESEFYCQYTLYTYFESQVILSYIFLFILIVFTCCICCLAHVGGDSGDSSSAPSSVQPASHSADIRPRSTASLHRAQPFMFVFEKVEIMYSVET